MTSIITVKEGNDGAIQVLVNLTLFYVQLFFYGLLTFCQYWWITINV